MMDWIVYKENFTYCRLWKCCFQLHLLVELLSDVAGADSKEQKQHLKWLFEPEKEVDRMHQGILYITIITVSRDNDIKIIKVIKG